MIFNKKTCYVILFLQLVTVLSGVALFHLGFILVKPALKEFNDEFNTQPIMCTTTETKVIKKDTCKDVTCKEWCISSTNPPCTKIMVMARKWGANLDFHCKTSYYDEECSALEVPKSSVLNCKNGECKFLTGLFNCTTGNGTYNPCRRMSPAYTCGENPIFSNIEYDCSNKHDKRCKPRLEDGVYNCFSPGRCLKFSNLNSYKDCKRKCINLSFSDRNVVIFSKDRLIKATCSAATSDNTSFSEKLGNDLEWRDASKVLMLFCVNVTIKTAGNVSRIVASDCFNDTLEEVNNLQTMTSFLDLNRHFQNLSGSVSSRFLQTEDQLRIIEHDTLLKINAGGCLNTLRDECRVFLDSHSVDGKDGRTRDRFQCYSSNLTNEYVIKNFDRDTTWMQVVLGSILPACLLLFFCFCLLLCSKSIKIIPYEEVKGSKKSRKK